MHHLVFTNPISGYHSRN